MSISPMSDIQAETDRNLMDQAVIVRIYVHWGRVVHTEAEGMESG